MKWEAIHQPIADAKTICGQQLPPNVPCNYQNSGPNLPFQVTQACGVGEFDTRGLPHHMFDTRLTMTSNLDHGYFYCAAHDLGISSYIELSRCKATNSMMTY